MSCAKILDCGDAPLTFLDNTVALKQLEKAHKVCYTEFLDVEVVLATVLVRSLLKLMLMLP